MVERSIVDIVAALSAACANNPDASALRVIRETVDEPAFRREIAEFLRGSNSDDVRDRLRRSLALLQRAVEEIAAQREGSRYRLGIMGIGGGTGLVTGALATAITLASPVIAILPLAAGFFMVVRYIPSDKQLGEEVTICRQIADEIKTIRNEDRHG